MFRWNFKTTFSINIILYFFKKINKNFIYIF
nr:MAG TPA: hypothetical protein [Caudoviricetes sp.]